MIQKHLFTGIDIGSLEFVVCFLNSDGDRLSKKALHFSNNINGASKLVESSIDMMQKFNLDSVSFAMESTSTYHWHLANFLLTHQNLIQFNPSVYCINPRLINNFKKAYPDLQHNDDVDAFVIADRLRFGRLPFATQYDFLFEPIKRLTRFRYHLVSNLAREKQYFLNILFYKFSTYSNSNIFSDIFGATSLSILSEFKSVDEIISTPIEQLTAYIIDKGKKHFKNPKEISRILKQAAVNSYKLDKTLADPINTILASIHINIRALKSQIKKIDSAIEQQYKAFPNQKNILSSIPGIGNVLSAGILAETGKINKFHSQSAYGKYAGLVWKKSQSGKFEAEESFLTKKGNIYLKYYIIESANLVRRFDPVFKAFYQKKYKEAVKHHHKRAVVLTARKLLRVIYYLLRDNKLYSVRQSSRS